MQEYDELIVEPRIDDKLLDFYHAEMLSYSVGALKRSNGYLLPARSLFPIWLQPNLGTRKVKIKLDVEGRSRHDIEMNISKLTQVLSDGCELLLPDGFYYSTVLDKASDTKEVAPWLHQITFELIGARHGAKVTEKLTESASIYVLGNMTTPVRYTVTPSDASFRINDIEVSGVSGTVILDGIEGRFMQGTQNVFSKTNITDFPKLDIGKQEIELENVSSIKIEYYPLYY